jgi:hypothetical protein
MAALVIDLLDTTTEFFGYLPVYAPGWLGCLSAVRISSFAFDRATYRYWLGARADSEEMRTTWALNPPRTRARTARALNPPTDQGKVAGPDHPVHQGGARFLSGALPWMLWKRC